MEQNFDKIRRLSADIRIQTTMAIGTAGFGHIGGAASIADVLAVLYGGMMRIDPKRPDWSERDWMILSKGHWNGWVLSISLEPDCPAMPIARRHLVWT